VYECTPASNAPCLLLSNFAASIRVPVRHYVNGHKYWQACADFCERWDQAAFDPEYKSLPLEHFVPMVERVLAREPFWWDVNHPKRGVCGVSALDAEVAA